MAPKSQFINSRIDYTQKKVRRSTQVATIASTHLHLLDYYTAHAFIPLKDTRSMYLWIKQVVVSLFHLDYSSLITM